MSDSEHDGKAAVIAKLRRVIERDEEHRNMLRKGIEVSRIEFVRSKSPEFALRAHQFAQSLGEPTPGWAIATVHSNKKKSRRIIRQCQEDFIKTGNPMYAWQAYLEARSIEAPMPEFVLEYLDRSASDFWRHFQGGFLAKSSDERKPYNHPDQAFLAAFGISRPKIGKGRAKSGRGTVWSKFIEHRWIFIGSAVMHLARGWREDRPFKTTRLVADAAVAYNQEHPSDRISEATAWRDWTRYKRQFPERAVELADLAGRWATTARRIVKKSGTF